MIEKLQLENFRGFKKLELSELMPLTLISGKNNTGKSSVLEGIFLLFDHTSPDSFSKINYFRGNSFSGTPANLWESAFHQMDTSKIIRISAMNKDFCALLEYSRDDSFTPRNDVNLSPEAMNQIISSAKASYTLRFQYREADYTEDGHLIASPSNITRNITTSLDYNQIKPMPPVCFINSSIINSGTLAVTEWFGRLELEGKKQTVINIMRLIEPTVCDLSTIVIGNQAQLYTKIGQQLLPLRLAGDGLNKLLYIILAITASPNTIFLIDEIETGFHYSMFPKLWETIANTARESNCQIIATTHSYECIVGAMDGTRKAEREHDFCYLRLDKTEDEIVSRRYSSALLETAVMADMEVR